MRRTVVISLMVLSMACVESQPPAPSVASLVPDQGPDDGETPVTVTGAAFLPRVFTDFARKSDSRLDETWTARLGDSPLLRVKRLDEVTLNAVVPAGLPAGTHDLHLVDPWGREVVLPAAYRVIGVGVPVGLVFTTPGQTLTEGECSGLINVGVQDGQGTPALVGVATRVSLSASPGTTSFFIDATCSSSVTSVEIPANEVGVGFRLRAQTAGTLSVTALSAGLISATQQHLVMGGAGGGGGATGGSGGGATGGGGGATGGGGGATGGGGGATGGGGGATGGGGGATGGGGGATGGGGGATGGGSGGADAGADAGAPSDAGIILFEDHFETGGIANWTLSGPGAGWVATNTSPNAGLFSGRVFPSSTNDPASVIERSISTLGHSGIRVEYARKLVGIDSADEFRASWFDGVSWNVMEQTGTSAVDDLVWVPQAFLLPAAADHNAAFKLRFDCTAGAVSESCSIDDVVVWAGP